VELLDATDPVVGITNPERGTAVEALGVVERGLRPRFDRIGWLVKTVPVPTTAWSRSSTARPRAGRMPSTKQLRSGAVTTGKERQFSRADVFELSLADRLPVRQDAHPDRAKRINPAPGGDRCSVVDDSVVLAVHLADRSSTPEWPDDVLSDT